MRLVSVAEAADRLGLAPVTIRWYIEAGRLPAQKIADAWLIDERDLARFKRARPGRPIKRP